MTQQKKIKCSVYTYPMEGLLKGLFVFQQELEEYRLYTKNDGW